MDWHEYRRRILAAEFSAGRFFYWDEVAPMGPAEMEHAMLTFIERDWALLCRAPEMNRLVLMPGGDDTLLIVSLRRLPLPSVRRFQGPMWSCVRSALEFLDEHRAVCKGAAAVGEGGQSRSTPGAQDAGTSRLSAPSPDRGYL